MNPDNLKTLNVISWYYVSLSKASLAPLTVQEWCQIFPEVGPDNTVDDEVDAAVEKRHHVHQVAQRGVALEEEPLPKHHAKKG